ncbi:MAG: 30S ribosomal protein S21 [bacterium]|nr:30S ribosomal protein S21 [bacterium]
MVDVKRKERESLESLIRRFNKRVMQSGRVLDARKSRFFERKKSRNLQRQSAIRSAQIKAEKDLERKLGKLPLGSDRRNRRGP